MNAKIANFTEMSKLLSEKRDINSNLLALFTKFGLGRLLCRLSMEKHDGISAVQLILSLCLFRINKETIHSIYKKKFYGLLDTGKNCYYRMLTRESMDWRRLMNHMVLRFICLLHKNGACEGNAPSCLIVDDTTVAKTGIGIERTSSVFDHVLGKCILGYKVLLCAYFDGKSTIPFDFSIHREKGKNKNFGLTKKQLKGQYTKKRKHDNPDNTRLEESDMSKIDVTIQMIRRAWKLGLRVQYTLCDSWFTCEGLIKAIKSVSKGMMHFVGLAKMGKTRYLVRGKLHNANDLVALYERTEMRSCRKYKCLYICLNGRLGDQPVRIFLIRYGRNEKWNILLTSDLTMSFVKAFEIYQIRWNIEVINKETKNYLGLGGCQGRDFDEQIADCTLCYITYTVMALEKRFSDYETMGELFSEMKDDLMALTLWKRVLACIERLLDVLAERLGFTAEELISNIIADENAAKDYIFIANALEQNRKCSNV